MTKHFLHGCSLSEREVQTGIVKQLRKAGWEVWSFSIDSPVPKQWRDWIDVIAFKKDHTLLVECKATKRGGLTPGQAGFAKRMEAHQGPHLRRVTIRHPIQIEPWLVPGEGEWKC